MITVNNAVKFSNKKQPNDMELKGLSTDVKPTEVNGNRVGVNSIFLELDTNDFYYFDGEEWQKVVIEGGGSGEYDRDIAEIRNELKKRVYYFDNVASMKNSRDLKSGEYVVTKGYYEKNDGGGASYLIRAKTEEDVDDGGSIHVIGNLVAELIVKDDTVNVKQFGIFGDNMTDVSEKLSNLLSSGSNITYFIPNGVYLTNNTINVKSNNNIEFESYNAIIKANRSMENLFVYNDEKINGIANGNFIKNGTFDGNDLVENDLIIGNYAGFIVENVRLFNCSKRAFQSKSFNSTSYTGMQGKYIVARNINNAYSGSVGLYLNGTDAKYENCTEVDFETAVVSEGYNILNINHPWLTKIELYENSLAFYNKEGSYSMYNQCTVDTIRTAFKNDSANVINATNIRCFTNLLFTPKEIQEQFPFIFHNGSNGGTIKAINCGAYFDYGNNVVTTSNNSGNEFYMCKFTAGQNGNFNLSNYRNMSNVTFQLSNQNAINNPNFNNYYNETKNYYIGTLTNAQNKPSNNSGILCVVVTGSESINNLRTLQIYYDKITNNIFQRIYENNSWTDWINTSVNFNKIDFSNINTKCNIDNSYLYKIGSLTFLHVDISFLEDVNAWTQLFRTSVRRDSVYSNKIVKYSDNSLVNCQIYGTGYFAIGTAISSGERFIGDFIIESN